jgi:hypothetical protein
VIREWVRGSEGDAYLLLAGRARSVGNVTDPFDVRRYRRYGSFYLASRLFRVGGRVAVMRHRDLWAWTTLDEAAALATAATAAALRAGGEWVLERMPQPFLPDVYVERRQARPTA